MGRRLLFVIAGALAGCGRRAPALPHDAAPFALPIAEAEVLDAAPEPDAEPIGPRDVLSGTTAEQAIAAGKAEVRAPGERVEEAPGLPAGPPYLITSEAVGPFRLGASRAEVVRQLAGRAVLQRLPGGAGEPTAEVAVLPSGRGPPLLRLRLYAGRLQEIQVLTRDKRAVTDADLGVGVTFGELTDVYGDARPVREPRTGRHLGFVLQDLAGVLFVGAGGPRPAARVARIVVVGVEATAEEE